MATHRLDALLNPQSIALIGASSNPGRIGGMPIDLLTHFDYKGDIYPINPKYEHVFNLPCWPDIESLPNAVDLVVLAIAADEVLPMLQRCHQHGAKAAIVYAAGFAEEGSAEGEQRQQELEAFAQQSGMVVAGPNCMGFANLNTQAHTAFASVFKTAPMQKETGHISLLTQSGNVCSAMYGLLREQQLPVSHFINTGNEACTNFSDYLSYLAQDPYTDTIVGYIEELRDGPQFKHACEELQANNKVFIALKAGTTDKGAVAVQSHTSALAGDKKVYHAAFEQLGVIEATDFAQMAQIAYLAQFKHKQAGQRVAIVTMSGALGAILADRFIESGVSIPTLPDELQAQLREGIPSYGMVANPIDVTGNVVNDATFTRQILTALAQTAAVDCVVIYAPGYMLDRMAPHIAEVVQEHPRLFVAIDTGAATSRAMLHEAGVPVFTDIGRAVNALSPFLRWKQIQNQRSLIPDTSATVKNITGELAQHPSELEAIHYLEQFGITSPAHRLTQSTQEAITAAEAIGYPVVLKIVSPDIAHKTEVGGVVLGIHNRDQLEQAYALLLARVQLNCPEAQLQGVLVLSQQTGIAELVIGVSTDATFGPVLTIGLGGIYTELYQDTQHALLPVNKSYIASMLQKLIAYPLLTGFRGKPATNIDAVVDSIFAITQAYETKKEQIQDIEINPLLIQEQSTVALDALIICSQK